MGQMKKIVILFLSLLLLSGCSVQKRVRTKEFYDFQKEMLATGKVRRVDIYFRRPSLWIYIVTKEDFGYNDMREAVERLKPLINMEAMNEIARRYWAEKSHLQSVEVIFYRGEIDKNDMNKNVIYSLGTDYRKTHNGYDIPSNIDGYHTWYIEVNGKRTLLESDFKSE